MHRIVVRSLTLAAVWCGVLGSIASGIALAQPHLLLSKHADFSTSDGIFAFADILYAKVTAPQLNFLSLDDNEWHLRAASGGYEIEGIFVNLLNGTYVATIPLVGLNQAHSSWEFRAELTDENGGEFRASANLTITSGGTPEVGETIDVTGHIDSLGMNYFKVSGRRVFVDNATIITEFGARLAFSALEADWKVHVLAQRRIDDRFWALTIEVLERSTVGQEVKTEGLIASIEGAVVVVNDIRFVVVSTTQLRDRNDNPITLADLAVGMRVAAEGTRNASGEVIAEHIEIEDDHVGGNEIELTGTVTAVFATGSFPDSIAVNTTLFEVDVQTMIRGFSDEIILLTDLRVGELVELKAQTRDGKIPLATRIDREEHNGEDLEVNGIIQALGDSTLTVAQLLFRVAPTTIILDRDNNFIAFAALRTGLLVKVHANVQGNGSLIATRIKVKGEDTDEIEVKGFIDALTSTSLTVSGLTFTVDNSTVVIDHDDASVDFAALHVGMLVEVEGNIRFDGSLHATRIKIERFFLNEIEVRGAITVIDGDSLKVTGITFHVDANTVITGKDGLPLAFGELRAGMVVEIRAILQNGRWVALRVEVKEEIDTVVEISGRIDSLRTDSFFVFARRILVTNSTLFLDRQNQAVTFAALKAGDYVEVKAQLLPDGTLVALRVKQEDNPLGELELTGSITSLAQASISVSGVTFVIDATTLILNHDDQPLTINDLQIGMVVEVKARTQNDGTLLAIRIEVKERRALSGVVSQVTANTIAVRGLVHVLTANSIIFDEQNRITTAQALKVDQQVQLVAQSNQSQLEVITLRIVFGGTVTRTSNPEPALPEVFTLAQNYPNPFNPSTVIRFVLPQAGQARLAVYDLLGRRIRTLVDGMWPTGVQQVSWDGRDDTGAVVASGIYFYRLEANGLTATRRLTLLH